MMNRETGFRLVIYRFTLTQLSDDHVYAATEVTW